VVSISRDPEPKPIPIKHDLFLINLNLDNVILRTSDLVISPFECLNSESLLQIYVSCETLFLSFLSFLSFFKKQYWHGNNFVLLPSQAY
jgi:hypothetical protein